MRKRQTSSTIPLEKNIKKRLKEVNDQNEKPTKKRSRESVEPNEKPAKTQKTHLTKPTPTTIPVRRILNNAMVSFGKEMHARFANAGIRYLCIMHVDPGYRNGNNTMVIVDLLHPSTNIALSFKIDLYGEKNMPTPTREDVVDRMVDFMCFKYPRMYHAVHLCSSETQLERTALEYADSKAEHMATAMHAIFRSWGVPRRDFDVGIVHRAYPDIYPPFAGSADKTPKQLQAAKYAHNKKCSSDFVKHSVGLSSFEREVVAMDMVHHIERRLNNEVTGETKEKWDDYGDGMVPALVMTGYITNTPLLDDRLNRSQEEESMLHVVIFPSVSFVAQDMAVYREGMHTILLLKHDDFPFMPFLRKVARRVLEVDDADQYSSWDHLIAGLELCIVDLSNI